MATVSSARFFTPCRSAIFRFNVAIRGFRISCRRKVSNPAAPRAKWASAAAASASSGSFSRPFGPNPR